MSKYFPKRVRALSFLPFRHRIKQRWRLRVRTFLRERVYARACASALFRDRHAIGTLAFDFVCARVCACAMGVLALGFLRALVEWDE